MNRAMTSPLERSPPTAGPIVDLAPLAARLREVGYVADRLKRLGALPSGGDWLPRFEARRRCEGTEPLHVLARVFCLGLAEDPERLDDALTGGRDSAETRLGLETLVEAGLIVADGDMAIARAWLAPVGDQYFARDFSKHMTGREHGNAHVLGVGLASLMAAHLTVRPRVAAGTLALDLGTGQGFQAAQLGLCAERVIATDVSPRAIAFARWSLGLCGVKNAELREGSFFEPVEESRGLFDVITSNPPFMIGPDPGVVAFSNGLVGDAVTERIVREAPSMLKEGGFCTIVCNWHHDEDWDARPRQWIREASNACGGCDAWLIRCKTHDTRSYALAWLGELDTARDEITPEMLDRWQAYYEANEIGAISFGAIILGRRTPRSIARESGLSRANFFRAETLDWQQSGGMGSEQVRRVFAGLVLLSELPDVNGLLDVRLKAAPGLAMDQTSILASGAWRGVRPTLRTPGPLQCVTTIDDGVQGLLAGLDGTRTLREAVERMLGDLGGNRMAAQTWAINQARVFLEQGTLTPGGYVGG